MEGLVSRKRRLEARIAELEGLCYCPGVGTDDQGVEQYLQALDQKLKEPRLEVSSMEVEEEVGARSKVENVAIEEQDIDLWIEEASLEFNKQQLDIREADLKRREEGLRQRKNALEALVKERMDAYRRNYFG